MALRHRDLLEEAFPKFYYTVPECMKIATNYKVRKELWRKGTGNRGVYDWLAHKKNRWGKLTEENREWVRGYLGLTEEPGAETILLHIAIPEMVFNVYRYTDETALEFAANYNTRKELKEVPNGGRACYDYLNRKGLIGKAFAKKNYVLVSHLTNIFSKVNKDEQWTEQHTDGHSRMT
jgi:hypothetical protein